MQLKKVLKRRFFGVIAGTWAAFVFDERNMKCESKRAGQSWAICGEVLHGVRHVLCLC